MRVADGYCRLWGLDFDEMERETIKLIGENSDTINHLAGLLMQNKTLDEDQIKKAVIEYPRVRAAVEKELKDLDKEGAELEKGVDALVARRGW